MKSVERNPVGLETHGLGQKLVFDEHGLSPYWGVVSVFEPDRDVDAFEAAGYEWECENSTYWRGNIAPPEDSDLEDALYEYSYSFGAEDEAGDRDITIQFRPRPEDPTNHYSGEPMQAIPDGCPEGIGVQIMSSNLTLAETHTVLRAFAENVGLNPEYFAETHEYSRVYQLERYARLDRGVAEDRIVGDGGVIDRLSEFASGRGVGSGMHKWDHEEAVGHYESVAFDPDTWATLLRGHDRGKQFKCYHPQHVRERGTDPAEDPLAHPKVEVALSSAYDVGGTVSLSQYDDVVAELDEAAHNVLHWAGVDVGAESDVWTYEDPYFSDDGGAQAELVEDPLPELREQTRTGVDAEIASASIPPAELDVLLALDESGSRHYATLSDDAGVGTSTVYRLVNRLAFALRTDNGRVQFRDEVTRERIGELFQPVRDAAASTRDAIHEFVDRNLSLRGSDGESALEQWMRRHGVSVAQNADRLKFEIGRRLDQRELLEIVRAGYHAALESGMTAAFEDAMIRYQDRNRDAWFDTDWAEQAVVHRNALLGIRDLDRVSPPGA